MSFALGQFDASAYEHGRSVAEEAKAATGAKGAEAVTVAVWVNGYLQFAGSDASLSRRRVDRLAAKNQAAVILGRMNPEGEIDHKPAERGKVWLVVEAEYEEGCEGDTRIAHVCATRLRAQELLEQDGAFIANIPHSVIDENRYRGKSAKWEYDYRVVEMEVEP